eukprot:jgi/Ulvmu1/12025/UM083_0038.1
MISQLLQHKPEQFRYASVIATTRRDACHGTGIYRPSKLVRTGASAVVIEHCVYVFGGQEPSTGLCCNDVLKFDANSANWTTVNPKSGKPPPRHAHSSGKLGQHSFLIFGGASQSHEVMDDVWVFNAMTLEWKHVVPQGPPAAAREMAAGSALSEHQFVVTGGRGADGALLDDVVMLDISGDPTWTPVLKHDSIRRCAHSAICMSLSRVKVISSLGSSNPDGSHAETHHVQEEQPSKHVVIFGGFVGSGVSQQLVLLDLEKHECNIVKPDNDMSWPSPRFAHAACTIPNEAGHDSMCIFGGLGVDTDCCAWHVWNPNE